jgi:hypothetical protein
MYHETIRASIWGSAPGHSIRHPAEHKPQNLWIVLLEFPTANEQMTHSAFSALDKDNAHWRTGKEAFGDGIRDKDIQLHLVLDGNRTLK